MPLYEASLIEVVGELYDKGFVDDFRIENNQLVSTVTGTRFNKEDVTVEAGYQFDITENAIDTQNLFVISSEKYPTRGLLVDLLGTYLYMEGQDITGILNVPMFTYVFDDENPHEKYGLRRVGPAEFDQDPDRFELRKSFPDFPACPVGKEFTMLGFDKEAGEYVWLVTSILKDPRLKTHIYPATGR